MSTKDRGNEKHWTLTDRVDLYYEILNSNLVTQAKLNVDGGSVKSIVIGGQTIGGPRILSLLRRLLNDLADQGYDL